MKLPTMTGEKNIQIIIQNYAIIRQNYWLPYAHTEDLFFFSITE